MQKNIIFYIHCKIPEVHAFVCQNCQGFDQSTAFSMDVPVNVLDEDGEYKVIRRDLAEINWSMSDMLKRSRFKAGEEYEIYTQSTRDSDIFMTEAMYKFKAVT